MDASQEKDVGGKLCHFQAIFPRAVGVLLDRFKVLHISRVYGLDVLNLRESGLPLLLSVGSYSGV